MSRAKRRPLFALITVFGLLPAVFVGLVFLPVKKRMEADRQRLEAAIQRYQQLPNIQPLTSQERALLEDPKATWRGRIEVVGSDARRLAHYHRVVTDVQREFKGRGVELAGIRSTWNPILGSFTLPATLGPATGFEGMEPTGGSGKLQAWVLEARVGGTPTELFKALESLPRIQPLLEPVALRWESDLDQQKQAIVLRNLVIVP